MRRRQILTAAVFIATLFTAQAGWGQASFEELLRRLPDDSNVLVMINAEKARGSQFVQREGRVVEGGRTELDHHVFAPAEVELLVQAANIDLATLQPVWEVTMLATKSEPRLDSIARVVGGRSDTLAGVPAVWLPINGYVLQFAPRLVGMFFPGDRQYAARWAQDAQSSREVRLTPYLKYASTFPEAVGTELIMAMDLRHAVSPDTVRRNLGGSNAIKGQQVDVGQLSELLASIQGVTLGVRIIDTANGSLRIDFDRDASMLAPFAKALVLEKLSDLGATIDEMATWSARVEGKTVFLSGQMGKSGLQRILSLVEPPTPPMKEAPKSASESPSELDPKAESSLKYYHSIQSLVTDVKRPQADQIRTTGQQALWLDRYARKIDQLPILGVDPDLLDYSQQVATSLRELGNTYKGVGIDAAKESSNANVRLHSPYTGVTGAYSNRGRWGGHSRGVTTGTYWNYSPGVSDSVIKKRTGRADAAGTAGELFAGIDDGMAQMRRILTERYQIEF